MCKSVTFAIADVKFSAHALEQLLARCISEEQALRCLTNGELTFSQSGCSKYELDNICTVLGVDNVIVTVYRRTRMSYKRRQRRAKKIHKQNMKDYIYRKRRMASERPWTCSGNSR